MMENGGRENEICCFSETTMRTPRVKRFYYSFTFTDLSSHTYDYGFFSKRTRGRFVLVVIDKPCPDQGFLFLSRDKNLG